MKSKLILSGLLMLVLVLNACSRVPATSSPEEQPTPAVETPTSAGYQPVDVDQVEALVGVGSPIPVQVIVSGNLPDSCAQLELMQQKQVGSHFDITLSTVPSAAEGCVQDTLPFKIFIPLNIVNLPAGSYTVSVNGSPASFEVNTGNTTSSLPAVDSEITREDVEVASVNAEIGVGSPIPVHAIVGVNLYNTCAQVGEMRLHREGNTFYIQLIADIAQRTDCQADPPSGSIPFRMDIPLNIVNLPSGPYEVNVNGVSASFDPNAKPAGMTDLAEFESLLLAALNQRNPEEQRKFMEERFTLATWRSGGQSLRSEEAVVRLPNNYTMADNSIQFDEFQGIPGFDPQIFLGPDVQLEKVMLASGWGLDGKGEALLFIIRRPDGSLYWNSVLSAAEGFNPSMSAACTAPVEVPKADGKVSYNGISVAVDASLPYPTFARVCKAEGDDPEMGKEVHRPYTQFSFQDNDRRITNFEPEIRVYEVTGDQQGNIYPLNLLDELQTTLEQRPEPVTWFKNHALHTHEKYLDFKNGSGVRGLVQYMQDAGFYTNNGLTYEFNGLTGDGHYFVQARLPVSVPFLIEMDGFQLPPVNLNPGAIVIPEWPASYEQQRQVIEAYNNDALQRFEQTPDSDFSPDLALLDSIVQSIRVEQP